MVVDPSMLVIDNQQRGALPQLRVLFDRVVNRRDKQLAGLYVVIRMLVVRYFLSAVGIVIVVVRLDE